jgi:hypothetical protein
MPHIESPHEPAAPEEEPDDALRQVLRSLPELDESTHSRELTWQEHQARADEFYDQAVEREKSHGLDAETQALYEQVGRVILYLKWRGPKDKAADPINLMKLGGSLARQAQATEHGIFYDTPGDRHIDKKSNLQEQANKTLSSAFRLIMGGETHTETLASELADVNPVEVVAEAAVEAAKEAGTDEHVTVRGIGRVSEETPQRLEAEGREAVVRFIGQHAMDPEHGAEFIAMTAEHAIEEIEEQLTGSHELPVAESEKIAA